VRFDSIDHKNPNDPNAHTCDETLGKNVVPVFPKEATITIDNKSFVRRQLPLVLARATTIHKAQGRSVDSLARLKAKFEITSLLFIHTFVRVYLCSKQCFNV